DGNDTQAIAQAISAARAHQRGPALIAVRTHIGYGSPHKQDTAEAHGAPLGQEEVALTKRALGWPTLEPFSVPSSVLDHCRKAVGKGQALEQEWTQRFERYRNAYPALAEAYEAALRKRLPAGWSQHLPAFGPADKPMATRKASGLVLNAVAPALPALIGGSADLAESNNTYLNCSGDFTASDYAQRNIRFGVREHAMGAILNGMALHGGVIPFGGTFLVFSDYVRPAIRLAAMMKQHVIFVFTHDSIGLGEDGPTHQPVEQVMSLRLIPHLVILRPADPEETSAAWRVALEHRGGPVALVLTRQNVPHLPRSGVSAFDGVPKGGYILAGSADPEILLIGTGSEVQWALQAQRQLALEGVAARAVSMPSWELFEAQSQQYRDEVLPPGVWKRLSVEAGATLGWERYVGARGAKIGLDRFGASAPGPLLMEKFGFSSEHVLAQARRLLGRVH
ncbi:MAG TPA: transketolase C-terminal domain-containing protein, partial [Candidatus Bipolaricaulota bacterium]